MRAHLLSTVVIAILVLVACHAGEPRGDLPPPRTQFDRPSTAAEAGARAAGSMDNRPGGGIALDLDTAVRLALEHNPDLQQIRAQEPVSRAALAAARSYPFDPEVSLDARPYAREENGDRGRVLVALSLMQQIELAGQGNRRVDERVAMLDRAVWEIRGAEVATKAETERRFFAALWKSQVLANATAIADLRQEIVAVLERRLQAGLSSAGDLVIARLEASTARQEAELDRAASTTAMAELREQMALPSDADVQLTPSFDRFSFRQLGENGHAGPGDNLEALAWSRPDVKAVQADLRAAHARLDLASADRVPNLTLGPIYEHDEAGTEFLGLQLQMPLPFSGSRSAVASERLSETRAGEASLAQAVERARQQIVRARLRYEQALAASERLEQDAEVDPVAIARRQFDAGLMGILQVHDASLNALRSTQNRITAKYELCLAASALAEATALPIESHP